jgi:hypothetical protein
MKFINYLNEDKIQDYKDILDTIEEKCSKYLKELRKSKNPTNILLSGRSSREQWFQGIIRKNRQPRDTPAFMHKLLDDYFEHKTGTRLRSNSLFCVNSVSTASSYGKVYFIFPIGNYETWYHPEINDLHTHFSKHSVRKELDVMGGLSSYDKIYDKLKDEYGYKNKLDKYLKNLINGYRNGFPDKSETEVMLTGCLYYYAVNMHWTQWASNTGDAPRFFDWLWRKK